LRTKEQETRLTLHEHDDDDDDDDDDDIDLLTRLRAGRPRNLCSIPGIHKKFSASSKRPYVSAASSGLQVYDYRDLFPWGKAAGA
jgi:hypothetical protein